MASGRGRGVGGREGAAAAVEEAEGDAEGLSLAAFLAASSKPILCRPSVAQLFHGNASDHHDLVDCEMGKPLHQNREHNLLQIRPDRQLEQKIQLETWSLDEPVTLL